MLPLPLPPSLPPAFPPSLLPSFPVRQVYRNLALELGFAVNGSTAEGGSTDNAALLNYLWSSVIGSSDGSSKIVAGFSQPMITV